jgi:hypothetical protein
VAAAVRARLARQEVGFHPLIVHPVKPQKTRAMTARRGK